jgi:hypothetical protein
MTNKRSGLIILLRQFRIFANLYLSGENRNSDTTLRNFIKRKYKFTAQKMKEKTKKYEPEYRIVARTKNTCKAKI